MSHNLIRVLAWNTEKGPLKKRAAIGTLVRTISPDIAFFFEASNSFDRNFPYPDWLKSNFENEFSVHESPSRSQDNTGTSGMIVMIKMGLPVAIRTIGKLYAIISSGGSFIAGMHLQSATAQAGPRIPDFFDSESLINADCVTADFNQLETGSAATFFTSKGFAIMNPDTPVRVPTCSTGSRALDHTLAKPGCAKWESYQNRDFSVSDHVAQVFNWIPSVSLPTPQP